jgi:hypothetical protein
MAAVLAIVLLMTAPAVFSMPAPHQAPAGCHEHARRAPSPEPVSYQCCQTGHNAAVLTNAPNARPLFFVSEALAPETFLFSAIGIDGFCQLLTSSSSPPGSTPLRV